MEVVLERSTGKDSFLHGEGHWWRVAAAGLALLQETPEADRAVVFLFALFHDSVRLNDGHDPLHGPRGAALAGELRGEAFELEEAGMDLLAFACEEHANGGVSSEATVAVCWDADRLNLWWVRRRPNPRWPFSIPGPDGPVSSASGPEAREPANLPDKGIWGECSWAS